MKLLAGTSGYAFKEWKGNFYPADLKDDGWLRYYASKFPSVEINNTFYRLPKETVLLDWAAQVPDDFTFAIKASQRITHFARLKEEAASPLDYLLRVTVPDIESYDRFYKKFIDRISLSDVSSSFAIEQIKYTTALPLNYAENGAA